MPTYLVIAAAALKLGQRIDAATWDEAIALVAQGEQGSGKYVSVPVAALKRGTVSLDLRPTATVTDDATVTDGATATDDGGAS